MYMYVVDSQPQTHPDKYDGQWRGSVFQHSIFFYVFSIFHFLCNPVSRSRTFGLVMLLSNTGLSKEGFQCLFDGNGNSILVCIFRYKRARLCKNDSWSPHSSSTWSHGVGVGFSSGGCIPQISWLRWQLSCSFLLVFPRVATSPV